MTGKTTPPLRRISKLIFSTTGRECKLSGSSMKRYFDTFQIFRDILIYFEIFRDLARSSQNHHFLFVWRKPTLSFSMGGMLLPVKTINTLLKKTINSVLPAYIRQVLLAVTGILSSTKVPGTYQYVNVSRPPPLGA